MSNEDEVLDRTILVKQIAAAVLTQDQLVFTYKHDGQIVVRYVTPVSLENDSVLCTQILPEEGWRRFMLDDILNFHRVISRDVFTKMKKKDAKKTDDAQK